MKFTTAIAITAIAAVANAQSIQFSNPNVGTKWTTGKTDYNTAINIVYGDPLSLQYRGVLGTIDCTSGDVSDTKLLVPDNLEDATAYSLQAMTDPRSYSPAFTISSAAGTVSSPSGFAPAPDKTDTPKSAGNSLTAFSAMLAVAGVVAVLSL